MPRTRAPKPTRGSQSHLSEAVHHTFSILLLFIHPPPLPPLPLLQIPNPRQHPSQDFSGNRSATYLLSQETCFHSNRSCCCQPPQGDPRCSSPDATVFRRCCTASHLLSTCLVSGTLPCLPLEKQRSGRESERRVPPLALAPGYWKPGRWRGGRSWSNIANLSRGDVLDHKHVLDHWVRAAYTSSAGACTRPHAAPTRLRRKHRPHRTRMCGIHKNKHRRCEYNSKCRSALRLFQDHHRGERSEPDKKRFKA